MLEKIEVLVNFPVSRIAEITFPLGLLDFAEMRDEFATDRINQCLVLLQNLQCGAEILRHHTVGGRGLKTIRGLGRR